MEYMMARVPYPTMPAAAGWSPGDVLRQLGVPLPGLCEPGPSRMPADAAREFRQSKELALSPRTRVLYKDFSHALRSKETQSRGIRFAKDLAARCLSELPPEVHWRVHVEMADLAKREKDFADARRLYRMATELQPAAPQAWIEYAKMEEERGHFERCQRILMLGLRHCPYHEALMLKGIKHLEKMGDLPTARSLLSQLRGVPINQSWRTVLEGALLEARAGETKMARRIFKFLLSAAPWYGPVWYEACRFEQRCNHLREALRLAEEGLRQLPRYGPLWSVALRLLECVVPRGEMLGVCRAHVERGVRHISKDLVWKLWFEAAQVEERSGQLSRARAAYVKSVATCAPNLRWKVWLGGARTELSHARFDVAQALLDRALKESPPKTRAIVLLEQSRLHELRGDVAASRELLNRARRSSRSEWKVFLESLLLELRAECPDRALREAKRALEVHRGTGRLWAVLIQLEQPAGIPTQLRVFQQALLEVPKSGEVWCEGARICLNPFSDCYNLQAAHSFLDFAIEFTPQYGDSFIEYLRMLVRYPTPPSSDLFVCKTGERRGVVCELRR
jgi:la-related protein 1